MMTADSFILDLTHAAGALGCPLDAEATSILRAIVTHDPDEWSAGGVQRGRITKRARMVVLRAVYTAKAEKRDMIDGRTMRLALADTVADRATE
ncbi:MAG TPA: hypothetical protein VEB22_08790 [Phycisphaerales bacterium]|nr:hypothetical protein [Phycisphaerales bacterium]